MRIIVISDTHGHFQALWDILERHKNDAGLIVFLGDGLREFEDVQALYPGLNYCCVAGNCDYASIEKRTDLLIVQDKRILITHGDGFGVKCSTDRLLKAARENAAEIVLFGHTHCGMTRYEDGVHLMNPGSPSCPRNSKASYGILDIMPNGVFTNLVEI